MYAYGVSPWLCVNKEGSWECLPWLKKADSSECVHPTKWCCYSHVSDTLHFEMFSLLRSPEGSHCLPHAYEEEKLFHLLQGVSSCNPDDRTSLHSHCEAHSRVWIDIFIDCFANRTYSNSWTLFSYIQYLINTDSTLTGLKQFLMCIIMQWQGQIFNICLLLIKIRRLACLQS